MDTRVLSCDDVTAFLALGGEFLASQPILHNLLLTMLKARRGEDEAGRYWLAMRGSHAVGAALHSSANSPAMISPMDFESAAALAEAIALEGVELPGVFGEPAAAASFAGCWTEQRRSAAFPVQGFRLFALHSLSAIPFVEGELQRASAAERELAISWLKEFTCEAAVPGPDPEAAINQALREERLWLWRKEQPVSMVIASEPIEKVVRFSGVYTPPEHRRRGYAEAAVHRLSTHLQREGLQCILYTDLGNPTSNSLYRRIGYRAVGEALRYRFGAI